MLALGLLFVGIGSSLYAARPKIAASYQSYSSGPGSQRVISYFSSEQARAPFYVTAGLIYAALFAVGLALPSRRGSYIYLTALMPLGMWNIIGIVFAPILCIWWFRKDTRRHFGFGVAPPNAAVRAGKGSTVTAVFLVVVILGVVGILLVPSIRSALRQPQKDKFDHAAGVARTILRGCNVYAADHDGNFPASLNDDLFPRGLYSADILVAPFPTQGGKPAYEYLGGNSAAPGSYILFRSNYTFDGKCIVAYPFGDTVTIEDEIRVVAKISAQQAERRQNQK